jgi:hypothetical protein
MDIELAKMLREIAAESKMNIDIELERFLNARAIKQLFHFTSISNLPSLMEFGFLGREEMQIKGISFTPSDNLREEPIVDGICFSISKPNQYMMLNKISSGKNLVLLSLKNPFEILRNRVFIASPGNFGKSNIKLRFQNWPEEFVGGEGLSRVFLNTDLRGKYGLALNEPTDARAEIVILDPIPWDFVEIIYSPPGREYASQDLVREFTKICKPGIAFSSQNPDLFKEIDWNAPGVRSEYLERTWSENWI